MTELTLVGFTLKERYQYNERVYKPRLETKYPITVITAPYSETKLSPAKLNRANDELATVKFACLPLDGATHWFFKDALDRALFLRLLEARNIKYYLKELRSNKGVTHGR